MRRAVSFAVALTACAGARTEAPPAPAPKSFDWNVDDSHQAASLVADAWKKSAFYTAFARNKGRAPDVVVAKVIAHVGDLPDFGEALGRVFSADGKPDVFLSLHVDALRTDAGGERFVTYALTASFVDAKTGEKLMLVQQRLRRADERGVLRTLGLDEGGELDPHFRDQDARAAAGALIGSLKKRLQKTAPPRIRATQLDNNLPEAVCPFLVWGDVESALVASHAAVVLAAPGELGVEDPREPIAPEWNVAISLQRTDKDGKRSYEVRANAKDMGGQSVWSEVYRCEKEKP
jgi:hypothetical protein